MSTSDLLRDLPSLYKRDKKQIKRFLDRIKKRKPDQLEQHQWAVHQEVFEQTDCLDCANCCRNYSPIFKPHDINRLAGFLNIKPGQFIDQYVHLDEEGDYVLNTSPCPFLGEDNKCSVYEFRPKACREYPHTDARRLDQLTGITAKNVKVCPAAYQIVVRLSKIL